MEKKQNIGVIVGHLFWAIVCSVGAYYVEYGIMSLFISGGIEGLISVNVAGGAILFLLMYLLERKLVQEEITKRSMFVISTYGIPILYQAIMIFFLTRSASIEEDVVSFMFIFTLVLLVMGCFFRGMLEVVNYYRVHIKVKKRNI